MLKKIALLFILAFMCVTSGCSNKYYTGAKAFEYYTTCSREVFADGITFTAAVRGGNEDEAIRQMLAFMDGVNLQMSLTVENSALFKFNSLGKGIEPDDTQEYISEKVKISEDTANVIALAKRIYEETDKMFNIAVYPLTELWHVDSEGLNEYGMSGSLQTPPLPSAEELQKTVQACDLDKLELYCENGQYSIAKTDPRLKIDLGAIAKGYAADKCIEIAKNCGAQSALINISGNICVLGEWYHPERKEYSRWQVGVTSPRPRGGLSGNFCALSVPSDKTLVTSGDYVRFYETPVQNGETLFVPHIVNSVTGLPLGVEKDGDIYKNSKNHIISATVICNDSARADAYATAVCLMGMEKGTEFLRSRRLSGILVSEDGKMNLIGVSEADESAEIYFTLKDDFSAYKKYSVEEFAFE